MNRVSIAIVVIMTAINITTTNIIRLETLESLDRLKELEEQNR